MTTLFALVLLASASHPRPHPVWAYKTYEDCREQADRYNAIEARLGKPLMLYYCAVNGEIE